MSGFLLDAAIGRRDLPLIQGTILVPAPFLVILDIAAEVAQASFDPRRRRSLRPLPCPCPGRVTAGQAPATRPAGAGRQGRMRKTRGPAAPRLAARTPGRYIVRPLVGV